MLTNETYIAYIRHLTDLFATVAASIQIKIDSEKTSPMRNARKSTLEMHSKFTRKYEAQYRTNF